MNCRHRLLATLLLFLGIATAQPVEPGARNHPKDSGKVRTSNPAPDCESEAAQNGGWHLLLPGTATPQPWRTSPAIFLDRLWAISARGIVAESDDALAWREPKSLPPFAVSNPRVAPDYQMVAFSERLWVMTQHNAKLQYESALWAPGGLWTSVDGETWNKVSADLPGLKEKAILLPFGKSLVLLDTTSVWTSPDGLVWTSNSEQAPWGPRKHYGVATHGDALYLLGGRSLAGGGSAVTHMCTDVWKSEDGTRWECIVRELPFAFRAKPTLISHQDQLWLIGGITGSRVLNDTWLSVDGKTWTSRSLSTPWGPRVETKAVVFNDLLCLFGGKHESGLVRDALWTKETGSDWRDQTPTMPWKPREGSSVLRFKESWWLIGGSFSPEYMGRTLEAMDIWRTTDWKNWEQAGSLPSSLKGEYCQVLAGHDALWIVTLALAEKRATQPQLWRSEDGVQWDRIDFEPDWLPELICAAGVLGKNLVLFTEPPRKSGAPRSTAPWNVYASRNGKKWKQRSSIPYPVDGYFDRLGVYGHRGTLWAYPDGNDSSELWRTTDAMHWQAQPMTSFPERCYQRRFLWHAGHLWLTSSEWSKQESVSGPFNSYRLKRWWRTKNGHTWERVSHARNVSTDSTSADREHVFVDTKDGVILVNTRTCRVYKWDPRLAEQCNDDTGEIGTFTSSDFFCF